MRDLLTNEEKESEMTIVTTLGKGAKTAAQKDMKKDKDLAFLLNGKENEVIETYFRDDYAPEMDVMVEYEELDDEWFMD